MKIFIDRGHGQPKDTGAIGKNKEGRVVLEEALINELAPWVSNELQILGHNVFLSQYPVFASLNESLTGRVETANKWGANLFVSLHFNAYKQTDSQRGCETFYLSGANKALADRICAAIAGLGFLNRSAKKRTDLFVLRYTNMAAILIEPCFVDSTADLAILKSVTIAKLGKVIAEAISESLQA